MFFLLLGLHFTAHHVLSGSSLCRVLQACLACALCVVLLMVCCNTPPSPHFHTSRTTPPYLTHHTSIPPSPHLLNVHLHPHTLLTHFLSSCGRIIRYTGHTTKLSGHRLHFPLQRSQLTRTELQNRTAGHTQ